MVVTFYEMTQAHVQEADGTLVREGGDLLSSPTMLYLCRLTVAVEDKTRGWG